MDAFLEEFQHLKIKLEDIKLATSNFNNNNVIGKGGFGKVYKGVLSNSKKRQKVVAFKRLNRNYGQGDPEFWKEILMLTRYTHKNLICLLGFCDEDGEKILVYELVSHGSLDNYLSSTTLTWRLRLKICVAAAKGLSYLHHPDRTKQRVLHRDIKSSNILLDDNWHAKISDMGLSKIGPANQKHTFLISNVVGTLGYIDPMYMETGILTKESDVYSFGVVLFEVLCGRLCYEKNDGRIRTLGKSWRKSYKRKKLDEIIIQDLKQQMDPSSLKTFADIAYRCLKKSHKKRPDMYHVVEKLEIALRLQEIFEAVERPMDYEEMTSAAVPPLVSKSKDGRNTLLSNGINLMEICGDICMWRNPITTVLVHILLILVVYFPDPIFSLGFLYLSVIIAWNCYYRMYPPPLHIKTKISQADQGLQTDQEPDTCLSSRNPDLALIMYDRLRSVADRIQTIIQSLVTCRDPLASVIFLTYCFSCIYGISCDTNSGGRNSDREVHCEAP